MSNALEDSNALGATAGSGRCQIIDNSRPHQSIYTRVIGLTNGYKIPKAYIYSFPNPVVAGALKLGLDIQIDETSPTDIPHDRAGTSNLQEFTSKTPGGDFYWEVETYKGPSGGPALNTIGSALEQSNTNAILFSQIINGALT